MFDLQKIFTAGVKGIIAQGALAKTSRYGRCSYRMGNLKCALGQSISDKDYNPDMEENIPELEPKYATINTTEIAHALGATTQEQCVKLRLFQQTHDSAINVEDFIAKAKIFAATEGLEFPQ